MFLSRSVWVQQKQKILLNDGLRRLSHLMWEIHCVNCIRISASLKRSEIHTAMNWDEHFFSFFYKAAIDVAISDLAAVGILGIARAQVNFKALCFLMTECAPSSRRLIKSPLCHRLCGSSIWPKGLRALRRHLQYQITWMEVRGWNHRDKSESSHYSLQRDASFVNTTSFSFLSRYSGLLSKLNVFN